MKTQKPNDSYQAVGSFRSSLILTEEEEKWLRVHPLLPEEEQSGRIQRMLNDLPQGGER